MQKKAFSINALVDCLNRFLLGLILPLPAWLCQCLFYNVLIITQKNGIIL